MLWPDADRIAIKLRSRGYEAFTDIDAMGDTHVAVTPKAEMWRLGYWLGALREQVATIKLVDGMWEVH